MAPKPHNNQNKPGYALLLSLLIVVVIGMIIYYIQMAGPAYEIGGEKAKETPPWRLWDKFKYNIDKNGIAAPSAQQPKFDKPRILESPVKHLDHDRGNIQIFLNQDGTVAGSWGGQFNISSDVDYQVMGCNFQGYIDPSKLYVDSEKIEDPTKLYFLTHGSFTILETNSKNGKVRSVGGDVYVTGWISADYSATGDVVLTSDKKYFYHYTWQGMAQAERPLFKLPSSR